jgi:aminoglycoside phosphotransferase (APT) family kinase protein
MLTDEQRALVTEIWHERATSELPPERPTWQRPGWTTAASTWIEAQLAARGETLTAPIELVKSWALSCVLKATTAQGVYYLKTVAAMPLFVNEASVVKTLARLYPQQVPTPWASDVTRDWMLLPGLSQLLGWGAPVAQREAFLSDFGRLQVTAVADLDKLLAAGCLDRRLAQLPAQIGALLTSEMILASVAEDEGKQLTALIPQLQESCSELASYGLPETLVHGDLHGGNTAVADEGFVYFDWTDACITHPFFDMLNIFFEEDTAVRRQLRDSYLAQWADFAPMDKLWEAWSLAELLGAVHHAVSYWQILANIESRSWYLLDWALPVWLRKILTLSETHYGS